MGQSSLVRRHGKALDSVGRASHMAPHAMADFAGNSDFGATRRYVHPNLETGPAAATGRWRICF
jgi:hypothetical protein